MTSDCVSLTMLEQQDDFSHRHIGPDAAQIQSMLAVVGSPSLQALAQAIVPADIRLSSPIALNPPVNEAQALAYLKSIAQQNVQAKQYIGLGYHDCITPSVILRNVLENPGWYTAYTPYQPEIAQGRLEALLNFQQMVSDLTAMPLANASLLDEATAAAEAMAMIKRINRKNNSQRFFVADDCLPQTIDVLKTRAAGFGFELVIAPIEQLRSEDCFGALLQYPNAQGEVIDLTPYIACAHQKQAMVAVAVDLLALTLLKPPGEMGADVVIGSAQRFGVPLCAGGPHAAFLATHDEHKRAIPGRIIGVSKDRRGRTALRMALQTREQHIRRDKANSNICTAQVLLANMAAFYAVYHGPQGLTTIARRIHRLTQILALGLNGSALRCCTTHFFDTLTLDTRGRTQQILQRAKEQGVNLRIDAQGDTLGVSLSERTTAADVQQLFDLLLGEHAVSVAQLDQQIVHAAASAIPSGLQRQSAFLQHPVFNQHHSETQMMRYLKSLENKDLALNHSMIALGSCTMKLNAATQMIPITWPEFASIHPFAPDEQMQGYAQMIEELEGMLRAITGFDAICMQPNSGAQGEYAGLLALQKYHLSRGDNQRRLCLIPQSAHGTNPASAQMAGMEIVVVKCDAKGNVDIDDLRQKVEAAGERLSCMMITYPSTHGVYETNIRLLCEWVHEFGGQVYMDGANMNAQVGLTQPGFIGADVAHLNLHKTFAIPHGGGGPGMGPIGVKAHLAPFVANHAVKPIPGAHQGNSAVSAAPYGSAGILPISWMYIHLLGQQGVTRATQVALLNANYMAQRLQPHYPVLYTGKDGKVAHECIIDLRDIKAHTGITEVDIAKRLMDFGFHAPTMSFPVAGTFMIEPTESESQQEMDRFIDAMIAIKAEIEQVAQGQWPADDNPLVNAPHTLDDIMEDNWSHGYSRQQAAFALPWVKQNKYWPSVNRVDDVYGDKNLICSCPALEDYL